MKSISIGRLRLVVGVSFWAAGLLGVASGGLGVANLALPSGVCGALAAAAGMLGAAATNRVAKMELEELQSKMRGEAIAFAVSL